MGDQAMTDAVSSALQAHQSSPQYELLKFGFAFECVERVRYLIQDEDVLRCFDVLETYLNGGADRCALNEAAVEAAVLVNRHRGSWPLDGVRQAAGAASYAVANALAGQVVQAADCAAYAAIYGEGGYGAVADIEDFVVEWNWQLQTIEELANALAAR